MTTTNHETAGDGSGRWLPMRAGHLDFLASARWAQLLREDLLPWLLAGGDLGDDVLEIGPGPGLTTELLCELAGRVTAIELDPRLAASLGERLAAGRVEVVQGDAADTGFPTGRFGAVACFHVLHHVPTPEHQDALFREAARVLRPGGAFLVADGVDTAAVRSAHEAEGETFVPLDPGTIAGRLADAGFGSVDLRVGEYQLLVRAAR